MAAAAIGTAPAMARPRPSILGAALAAMALTLLVPRLVLAHPLGNFTINVYAGLRVSASEIQIDAVLDEAEIPTFQERLRLDTDGDGDVSDAEASAAIRPECETLRSGLALMIDGARAAPKLTAAGLSFPGGAAGLSTMRLVCEMTVPLTPKASMTVTLRDDVEAARLGWREVVAVGDGVTLAPEDGETQPRALSVSHRLTAYPAGLISQPLRETEVGFTVTPGGSTAAPAAVPDATALPDAVPDAVSTASPSPSGVAAAVPAASPRSGVPGGVAADIPSVFTAAPSPLIALLAVATAVAIGAAHAVTPGHGKTLMAAYLVGSRGTATDAVVLALSVAASHTVGILILAAVVAGAEASLPPDVVVRTMPVIAGVTIVVIGGWMLIGEARQRLGRRSAVGGHEPENHHAHDDERRAPTPLRSRTLVALGLAGGIVPSTSALLILLATVAAGRAAFGLLLVIAFGVGMALVMAAIGLTAIRARAILGSRSADARLRRLSSAAPLLAALVVFGFGVWLTGQALAGRPIL